MQNLKSGCYWWFGINNDEEKNGKSGRHVIYRPNVEYFLKGIKPFFDWPRNIRNHGKEYDEMEKGDSVLFWMGDGKFPDWGIVGFGYIDHVFAKGYAGKKNKFRLKTSYVPDKTIKPYKNGKAIQTEVTDFLKETFSINFGPLYKNFKQIDAYKDQIVPSRIAITIAEINKYQYEKCMEYAKRTDY